MFGLFGEQRSLCSRSQVAMECFRTSKGMPPIIRDWNV
jgi:hypothetical protein